MKFNELKKLIGKIGVTQSELNPEGTIQIDDEVYEVRTEGEQVDEGRGVKVVRVQGKKIIVRRVQSKKNPDLLTANQELAAIGLEPATERI